MRNRGIWVQQLLSEAFHSSCLAWKLAHGCTHTHARTHMHTHTDTPMHTALMQIHECTRTNTSPRQRQVRGRTTYRDVPPSAYRHTRRCSHAHRHAHTHTAHRPAQTPSGLHPRPAQGHSPAAFSHRSTPEPPACVHIDLALTLDPSPLAGPSEGALEDLPAWQLRMGDGHPGRGTHTAAGVEQGGGGSTWSFLPGGVEALM